MSAHPAIEQSVVYGVAVPGTDGTDTMTGWQAAGYNASALPRVLKAYAICVPKSA